MIKDNEEISPSRRYKQICESIFRKFIKFDVGLKERSSLAIHMVNTES